MAVETLNEETIKVEKMSVLDGVVWAFAPEYEYLSAALGGFEWMQKRGRLPMKLRPLWKSE